MYSLEAATLGQVLHAKQIRAAHCLTSVQFSPTSEHLLLAYGRSASLPESLSSGLPSVGAVGTKSDQKLQAEPKTYLAGTYYVSGENKI